MVNVAVVGVGGYGGQLIDELLRAERNGRCRLTAAADARLADLPEQAARLKGRGAALYDDALEMFRRQAGRCEAVYIASSIPSHTELTLAAAECGYHVHLEKPPAATVQEVRRMLNALAEADRVCLVGFQALYGHMRLLIDRIAEGRLGRIVSASAAAGWPRAMSYYRRNDWAGRLRLGESWVLDGPAANALAHQVAHMLAMASGRGESLARPASVRAELYAAGPVESHNLAAIEVITEGGAALRFFCSHATNGQFGPVIEIAGEKGRAVYDHGRRSDIEYADGAREGRDDGGDAHRPHQEMIANFLNAVRSGDPSGLRCSLRESMNYVLALNGAHESSGRIHRIDAKYWRMETDTAGEHRVVVEGVDDLLKMANEQGKLFSDLDHAPPWAVATEPFDLTGYTDFPQRFACE